MGYDLFLHILGLSKPSHICQFHSTTFPHLNLPTLPDSILFPETGDHPILLYVQSIHSGANQSRFTAAYNRMLILASYFYSVQFSGSRQNNQKWWDFDQPLIRRVPWCLNWTGLTK